MKELAPIGDLVEQFAQHHEAVEILRELRQRRPAIMVGEWLDKLKPFAPQPERREPRSLKNHPLNPAQR